MIIPPISKMISSVTPILLTACSTAEDVDQALIIAVKFMVDFISVTFPFLRTLHLLFPQPTRPPFLSSGYSLDLTMQSCVFRALLYETIAGSEKTF